MLIVSGSGPGALPTTELYNPWTGTFSYGPSLNTRRQGYAFAMFPDGQVLAMGVVAERRAAAVPSCPYPVGTTITVYYDPRNPASAVLEPGVVGELALLYKMDLFFVAAFTTSLLIALDCSQSLEKLFASPLAR